MTQPTGYRKTVLGADLATVPPKAPAPPPVDPTGPIVVQGRGWRATVPAALLAAVVSAITTVASTHATSDTARQERTEAQQARFQDDVNRRLDAMNQALGAVNQRLDRVETRLLLQDELLRHAPPR